MLAGTRHQTRARRGIVLVLVLAMLGLLALIGVTFATFSGQARINSRNYAQSVIRPQDDELMDFALQQLITDTADPRSVIRGHSLARDMYGNDAYFNGYVASHPTLGTPIYITGAAQNGAYYNVSTNIQSNDTNFYAYNFTRWIIRVAYQGTLSSPTIVSPIGATATPAANLPVQQTFEIIADSGFNASSTAARTFTIAMLDPDPYAVTTNLLNPTSWPNGGTSTNLINWGSMQPNSGGTMTAYGATATQLPGAYILSAIASSSASSFGTALPCVLDGRWLHAFNGPGIGTQYNTLTINYGNYTNNTVNVPYSAWGNFRYNGLNPNTVGMDEDYDACDLENWFLAIQSADGQVMIPSFHRPGIVRYQDSNATTDKFDWDPTFRANYWQDSASRILRPVAADGHDPTTFKDLVPDPTGKITYDVDNDGDGVADSVWLDLGYPARRDSSGNMYKPLFAFMVIGLNGRIPLNTAGNLASGGTSHAQHLGNSVSEIDPTYGLQNAYVPYTTNGTTSSGDADPFNQMGSTALGGGPYMPSQYAWPNSSYPTSNAQVDNAVDATPTSQTYQMYQPVDVRLTQLRNLLAGTRPQANPLSPNTATNGETDIVYGSWPGSGQGAAYTFPNGIANYNDVSSYSYSDGTNSYPLVQRTTPPVPGRWGEAASVPGVPFPNPSTTPGAPPLNLVQTRYANPVRAGYSFDPSDIITYYNNGTTFYDANGDIVFPADVADDNYNAFDVYPTRATGEVGDADYYDTAGALVLPVERMRRFVTPIDINGTGRVQTWNSTQDYGPDNFGRVQFSSYFRPAGVAGTINTYPIATGASGTLPYGAIVYGTWATGTPAPWVLSSDGSTPPPYLPDVTNNPLHGYEWFKMPNSNQVPGVTAAAPGYNTVKLGGMPVIPSGSPPTTFPTYNNTVNSSQRLDGVNEADEMNLYTPNPLLDSPYGPPDLEWLYRQQDVDGATMTSRLKTLAPVSFTNTIDGQRRRRLYSLDSWESTNFVWTNDNPGGNFANNSRFAVGQNASMYQTSLNTGLVYATPSLAHRDRKINLNYPLPVSNDPNEPVRQKWISETYHLLKVILPPTSVDSPEELAQLSQFVINIIDFRDPDATMTHWVNPDVWITPGSQQTDASSNPVYTNPVLTIGQPVIPTGVTANNASFPLEQYGMEYNPVAINEVLAYGFQTRTGTAVSTATYTNRFFIELVNTLTAAYNPTFDYTTIGDNNNYYGYGTTNAGGNTPPQPPATTTAPPYQASTLDLGGFSYTTNDPYSGGCWDLVFTADDAMSRPDPYRGDLLFNPNVPAGKTTTYGLIPLNRDSVSASFSTGSSGTSATGDSDTAAPNGGDVTLIPLSPNASNVVGGSGSGNPVFTAPATQPSPPINYFYVVGSLPNSTSSSGTSVSYEYNPIGTTGSTSASPCMTQYIIPTFDPFNSTGTVPPITYHPGILPAPASVGQFYSSTAYTAGSATNGVPGFQWKIPAFGSPSGPPLGTTTAQYYWVCLRRPANPFAPVSAANPMVVVDSMRFPYIDGTANAANAWTNASGSPTIVTPGTSTANTIYSAQRLQPYRGGHAVPLPSVADTPTTFTTNLPPDPRYGYTEQTAVPQSYTASGGTYGLANPSNVSGSSTYASTNYIYHTLGYNNDSAENWDYFVFNDRDFSSVAELLLVPGCPPGLFTKQFVEFATSQMNAANIFGQVTPIVNPLFSSAFGSVPTGGTYSGAAVAATTHPTPFATATVPFLDVSQATAGSGIGSTGSTLPNQVPAFPTSGTYALSAPYAQPTSSIQAPVQPHAFPYLVDRFFYTGASSFDYTPNGNQMDPGSPTYATAYSTTSTAVVGGPGGDGWFKMFEFFEVPSQSNGSIGTVAQGTNFDWARQDTKPGLMNINLVIDEEAFFAIFGRQGASGFNQALLNSIELPLLTSYNANNQLVLPYGLPLATKNNNAPPIPLGGPPVPMVVSAIQPNGAPNYVYPITDQTQFIQHGYLANDPIQVAMNTAIAAASGTTMPPVGNRLKAAFAQFLWARHGGSGYLFAHGVGSTGMNSAVATINGQTNGGAVPAEMPFHSLSYPDINYTIMRPAALPPSATSNPPIVAAQGLFSTPPSPPTNPYFLSASYYSPFVTTDTSFGANTPIVYSGDPGVRSPYFNPGYVTSGVVSPYTTPLQYISTTFAPPYALYMPSTSASLAAPAFTVPPGVPLPLNAAFNMASPPGGATNPVTDSLMLPPPIPPARLFQIPDAFGSHQMQKMKYTGIWTNGGTAYGNIPPAVSHATDSGDPWINNFVANQLLNPYINDPTAGPSYTMTSYPPSYTLNHGFTSLMWGGGRYYNSASTNPPLLTPTGVLPPASINYAPYGPNTATYASSLKDLQLYNSYTGAPSSLHTPYLGGNPPSGAVVAADDRQHPFWRTELLQKAMNLTTVRTHQYAVWITIGFFEVKRQGDIGMLAQGAPLLAFDIMGPEVGALNGQNVRYRGFFLVDRLKLTGFNPGDVGAFHNAVIYRKVIQ